MLNSAENKAIEILKASGRTVHGRVDVLQACRQAGCKPHAILEALKIGHGKYSTGPVSQVERRSDEEVLEDLKLRFGMLDKLTDASKTGSIRSLVVSGAPGVGKTYNVMRQLEDYQKSEQVAGALSGVELYKLGFRNSSPGSVIVLDDADGIFGDEDALNVLKALCDSSRKRTVSWMKDSATLRQDDVPQQYDFHGSFIFISNLDFQKYVDEGKSKMVQHFEALMSRSLYLDLRLHDRQAIALWISYVATAGKMFAVEGVSQDMGDRILAFINKHRDDFRELSLRTAMKIIQLSKSAQTEWEGMARVLLCRS